MKLINSYRIISALTFMLLCITCLLTIVYCYSYIINGIIKFRIENSAKDVSDYYYREVVVEQIEAFNTINQQEAHTWIDDPNYISLMLDTIEFFIGSEAVNGSIINIKGQTIFSLDQFKIETAADSNIKANLPSQYLDNIGSIFYPSQFKEIGYEKSLLGEIQSSIMRNTNFRDSEGLLRTGTLIKMLLPIKNKTITKNSSPVIGIIELYFNITPSWQKTQSISYIAILFTFLIIFIISLHLRSVYSKFQNVIDVMLDLNSKLKVEKLDAENETNQKTIFLSTISHEMKTPLSAIAGYSDAMIMEHTGVISNPIYKQYVEDINNISKYTLSLVKDVLDYAKASVDKLSMLYSCFDVRKILIFSIRIIELRAHQSAIKISLHLSTESLPIMADQKRFKQCVLNILTNSIKYTPTGGEIKIFADIDKTMKYDQIKIVFEDNGIGIAPKDLSKAIENYEKINEVKSTKYEGTGLGLPFTKKLIELMGGKFEIESELGKGTKITFIFKYQERATA